MSNTIEKSNINIKYLYSNSRDDDNDNKMIVVLEDISKESSINVNSYDFHRRRSIALFMRRFVNNSNMFVTSVHAGAINNITDFYSIVNASFREPMWDTDKPIKDWATTGIRIYDTSSSSDITVKAENMNYNSINRNSSSYDGIFKFIIHDKGDMINVKNGETVHMIFRFKNSRIDRKLIGEKKYTFNPLYIDELEKVNDSTYFITPSRGRV